LSLIEQRLSELTPPMVEALKKWAAYGKGLRALLLQFSRARPGKTGPEDIEEVIHLKSLS
jgi:hypothetical protein